MSIGRDAWLIAKKELKGVFRDRRLVLSITVIPFLIFPLIFGALGFFAGVSQAKLEEETLPIVIEGMENAPTVMAMINDTGRFTYESVGNLTTALRNEEIFLAIRFPPNFETELNASVNATLNVTVLYNSAVSRSQHALEVVTDELGNFSRAIVYDRLERVNLARSALTPVEYSPATDVATTQQKSGALLGQLVPYLVVIYLFAGAMNVGLDAITGEKERNTLSTLLVNRIRREAIVMGKILAVMVVAFISAGSTFGGIAASLAGAITILGGAGSALGLASLSPTVGLALIVILLPLSALIVSIIVLIGTYAKSMKEGGSLVSPIYIIVIVIGLATMGVDFGFSDALYGVPFVGAMFALKNAFIGKLTAFQLGISTVSTLVLTAIMIYLCVRMFKNERVIFRV